MATYMTEHRSRSSIVGMGLLGAAIALLLAGMLLAAFVAAPAHAASTAVIKTAALSGSTAFPGVNGEAKWKSKEGERELEVQIQDATSLAGKRLTVRIGGRIVGHMKVNSLGRARLVKSTQAGQSVPTLVRGKTVRIRTSGGVLVASGRF